MRFLVLSWDSLGLRDYRRGDWFDDYDAALDAAQRIGRNPRVRLALVAAFPDKPKRDLRKMILEEEAPYTMPRWLTGNMPRDGEAPRPKCGGCGRPMPKRAA